MASPTKEFTPKSQSLESGLLELGRAWERGKDGERVVGGGRRVSGRRNNDCFPYSRVTRCHTN